MAKKKFYQMNKGELEQVARALHVKVTTDYSKAEIVAAVEDAGFNEDDYWKRLGVEEEHHDIPGDVDNGGADAEVEEQSADTDEVVEADEEPAEDQSDEYAYGRFLGRNLGYVVPEGKFSRQRPVFRTTAENLDTLISKYPTKFRKATEREQRLA